MWLRNRTGLSGASFFAMGISPGIWGSSMIKISAPPSEGGHRGPPGRVQYRLAFSSIHSLRSRLFSVLRYSSGDETPWRMLWLFLVTRKTPGRGFGTYLENMSNLSRPPRGDWITYHVISVPRECDKRTRAWRINATPPPCGVELKKAILTFLSFRSAA